MIWLLSEQPGEIVAVCTNVSWEAWLTRVLSVSSNPTFVLFLQRSTWSPRFPNTFNIRNELFVRDWLASRQRRSCIPGNRDVVVGGIEWILQKLNVCAL